MGWLLELLFEGIRELCSQFIVDMMDIACNMFTEILSCDLSLFEELFGVVGDLYRDAVLPLAVALLLMILTWQVFKSMFGKMGVNSEDPMELVFRSAICLFMLMYAKDIVNYILELAGTPYHWIVGTDITVESFSGYVTAAEAAVSIIGGDAISISLLLLIMHFVVAWNYFKLLFILAERYVLLGVFSYTAPLAFATGGAKATNNILTSWTKMFGGQVMLVILDAWCLKMFLAGYGNLMASGYGFTKFFAATMCLIGFCKIAGKLDSYMASMGISMGRTMGGLSGLGALMMAGRLLQGGGRTFGSGSTSIGSGHMNFGGGRPIPIGGKASVTEGMSSTSTEVGAGIGGMSVDNMAENLTGKEKEPLSPEIGDGFGVFQPEDTAFDTQNLPFGEPDDNTAFSQDIEDEMAMAPFKEEENLGDLSAMETDINIPDSQDMEMESAELPFGNYESIPGEIETGSGADISGIHDIGESNIMEDVTEGKEGIGGLEGNIEGGPNRLGTEISSYGESNRQEASDSTESIQSESGGISGIEIPESGSSGNISEMESIGGGSGQAMYTGETLVAGEVSGSGGGISADDAYDAGGRISMEGAQIASGAASNTDVSGRRKENVIEENQRGFYPAERDGKEFMRYDSGLYEKPRGSYQTIHENGKTFYEIPKQEAAPALRPETNVILEKDGTLRLEKVYQKKENTQIPVEPKNADPKRPDAKKGKKKLINKPTGTRGKKRPNKTS